MLSANAALKDILPGLVPNLLALKLLVRKLCIERLVKATIQSLLGKIHALLCADNFVNILSY